MKKSIVGTLVVLVIFLSSAWGADSGIDDLLKRANAGETEAQFLLGQKYEKGDGVNKNFLEALKWYEKAVTQKHQGAIDARWELTGGNIIINNYQYKRKNASEYETDQFEKSVIKKRAAFKGTLYNITKSDTIEVKLDSDNYMTVKFRDNSGAEIQDILQKQNITKSNFERVVIFLEGRITLLGTGILINHRLDDASWKTIYY